LTGIQLGARDSGSLAGSQVLEGFEMKVLAFIDLKAENEA
jgi:hypothetical protein